MQILGSLSYYISLILLDLLSNYILKLWQEISCPEIAKQNVSALASIGIYETALLAFSHYLVFIQKLLDQLKIKPGNFLRYCVLMIPEYCQIYILVELW